MKQPDFPPKDGKLAIHKLYGRGYAGPFLDIVDKRDMGVFVHGDELQEKGYLTEDAYRKSIKGFTIHPPMPPPRFTLQIDTDYGLRTRYVLIWKGSQYLSSEPTMEECNAALIDALIELGWTPPETPTVLKVEDDQP